MDLERIEAALRSRPADEPEYGRPLAIGEGDAMDRQQIRPRTGARIGGAFGALGGLVVVALVVVLAGLGLSGRLQTHGGGSQAPDGRSDAALVTCSQGGSNAFSVRILDTPANAEAANTAQAAALRQIVSASNVGGLPKTGWWLTSQGESAATFLAKAPGGYAEVTVQKQGDHWVYGSAGVCVALWVAPPDGYWSSTLTLDPAFPVTPSSTELHLLVQEAGCHGTVPATGRTKPEIAYGNDRVVVNVWVKPIEGAATCPLPPPTPLTVQLTQPLGSRAVFDGSQWPAVEMASADGAIATTSPLPTMRPGAHVPSDCSGGADAAGVFKVAAYDAPFDVYCAVLPDGWTLTAHSFDATANKLALTYSGPNGASMTVTEGLLCPENAVCDWIGGDPALFADLPGTVGEIPSKHVTLYALTDGHFGYVIDVTGSNLATVTSIGKGFVLVAK